MVHEYTKRQIAAQTVDAGIAAFAGMLQVPGNFRHRAQQQGGGDDGQQVGCQRNKRIGFDHH